MGYASKIPLPPYIRSGMFRMFCSSYGVNMDEIKEDLNDFRNFNQFFTRELKDGIRPVDEPNDASSLVSPCDGKITSFGEINTMD